MNAPYLIFPIGIFLLVLYLLTYLMVRLEILKISVHRQIWNILLLTSFLVTASLGLILAIEVNYKLKIIDIDQMLVWHVDFGIGMAMIAIFHFLWHWTYYIRLFNKRSKTPEIKEGSHDESYEINEKYQKPGFDTLLPVFAMGMTAIITQVVLLREFMAIFQGNELVIGTILANWMILTALGAFLGRASEKIKNNEGFIFYALFFSGIIPIITVFLLNYLKNIIFPIGTMIGLFEILIYSLILLLPFCLLSGFLFTYYAQFFSQRYRNNLISLVYSVEAGGSLLAGLVYSFILIYFFRSTQILTIILVVNIVIALKYSKRIKNWRYKTTVIIFLVITVLAGTFIFNLDIFQKSFLFPNQKISLLKDTPFGSLVVTESAGQNNFYENNVLLYSTDNVIGNEELVHFTMLQHPNPRKILLMGGGISGLTKEILKYPVLRIDYVEINNWIIRIAKKFTNSLNDQCIKIINEDARMFVRKAKEKYDIVIMDIPSPASAQINRFYTIEFLEELKDKVNEGGVISMSLSSTENYVSERAAAVQSIIFNTLRRVFNNVSVLPGEKNYFIASDKPISLNITKMIGERGIENVYVNSYYLDDEILQQRSNFIMDNLQKTTQINKDFKPVAYFMEVGYWMSHFSFNYRIIGVVVLILLIILLSRINTINLGLFTTGFTSSSIEIMIIISFQIIYGFVYNMIGIIITIFMTGLALGAMIQSKLPSLKSIKDYWKIQFSIGIFSFIFPAIILAIQYFHFHISFVYLIFSGSTLIISVFTGLQFSLASKVYKNKIAQISAGIYSIDLLGSALGALLVAILLFPLLGLLQVFIFFGLINLLAAILSFRFTKR